MALAEGVRGAEQRMEAMASTRLAEGVTSGDKLALELDSVRAALESLRGLSDSRLSTVEGRLERLHDELNKVSA